MSQVKHIHYLSADKITQIHAVIWLPAKTPRGIVQIVHGMQEYVMRYEEFAMFLADQGYIVVANDHLGHGESVRSKDYLGYFAEGQPNKAVLSDIRQLHQMMVQDYPRLPYFLLGHSMGSFLARQYICMYGKELAGAVISGTGWHSRMETAFGMLLCKTMAGVKGWTYRSKLVLHIAMGNYNQKFQPVRTPFDWLTRDTDIVDAYSKDPLTQYVFTLNGFYQLFSSLHYLTFRKNLEKVPRDLPVLFISGQMDPVGNYGYGVKKAAVSLHATGVRDVICRLYPYDRHEVLNELNRSEVYSDVADWLEEKQKRLTEEG